MRAVDAPQDEGGGNAPIAENLSLGVTSFVSMIRIALRWIAEDFFTQMPWKTET
jgi:hypothetical protein